MHLPDIRQANVSGKKVLVRLDLDVPLSTSGALLDDTRLQAGIPTIQFLLKHKATVIGIGHLGRPEGIEKAMSLEPVAKWFTKKFGNEKQATSDQQTKIGDFDGWEITDTFSLLENIRFYPGERKNNDAFVKALSALADVYVNDSFAVCHRQHASIVGVPSMLPHFAGFHLQEEIAALTSIMKHPKRPLVVIIGGKKLETKLPLIKKMHEIADYVLVGGKLATETEEILTVQHEKAADKKSVLLVGEVNQDGTDATTESVENFLQVASLAKTIVWNGPIGVVEKKETAKGTRLLAEGIAKTNAYKVVGGGDSIEFLDTLGLLSKFDFVSTGGGAMLVFLSGQNLVGIEALTK